MTSEHSIRILHRFFLSPSRLTLSQSISLGILALTTDRRYIAFLAVHEYFSTMLFREILYSISSITFVGGIVAMFWFVMWKYVFEPNPLIRDFFDLDRRQRVRATTNKN